MVSEVVVFVLLYSMCCSIIEDRVCVFGVCFCCGISVCSNTEMLHASLFFFESGGGAFALVFLDSKRVVK